MNQAQWEPLERMLTGLSVNDKLEVIERIARSLQGRPTVEDADRAEWQRRNREQLLERLAALPVENPEPWSNRDHDRVLYGDPK